MIKMMINSTRSIDMTNPISVQWLMYHNRMVVIEALLNPLAPRLRLHDAQAPRRLERTIARSGRSANGMT
jgi:hypothetical protein